MSPRNLGTVEWGSRIQFRPAVVENASAVEEAADAGSDYRAVTLFCSGRRLDVNLPSSLPWADLQPTILRLMVPAGPAAERGTWVLEPVGGSALDPAESLCSAGVLPGDVLCLRQTAGDQDRGRAVITSVRDGVEDAVEARDQVWTPRTSLKFVLWCATVVGGVVLIPSAAMVLDLRTAGLTFAVAIMMLLVAVIGCRRGEIVCGALGVVVSCCWAAVGGCAVVGVLSVPDPAGPGLVVSSLVDVNSVATSHAAHFASLATAAVSALVVAGCAAAFIPAALVHATAVGVVAVTSVGLALVMTNGGSTLQACSGAAIIALLAIGLTPRVALAMSGLSALIVSGPARDVERRLVRAQQLVTGMLIGLSCVTVVAAAPALVSSLWWHRALAVGVGISLLLRSRTFSQTPHLIAPRIGALVIFAGLAVDVGGADPSADSTLILGWLVGAGTLILVTGWLVPSISAVGRARCGRILDLLDGAVVIGLLVLQAGLFGLFDWMGALIG